MLHVPSDFSVGFLRVVVANIAATCGCVVVSVARTAMAQRGGQRRLAGRELRHVAVARRSRRLRDSEHHRPAVLAVPAVSAIPAATAEAAVVVRVTVQRESGPVSYEVFDGGRIENRPMRRCSSCA